MELEVALVEAGGIPVSTLQCQTIPRSAVLGSVIEGFCADGAFSAFGGFKRPV